MKYYFPGKFDNPRYSENCYMDWPKTKKFGISVIENLIPVIQILKIIKYYFSGKFGNPRYLENNKPNYLKPRNPELASLKTFYLLLKYWKLWNFIFPVNSLIRGIWNIIIRMTWNQEIRNQRQRKSDTCY